MFILGDMDLEEFKHHNIRDILRSEKYVVIHVVLVDLKKNWFLFEVDNKYLERGIGEDEEGEI